MRHKLKRLYIIPTTIFILFVIVVFNKFFIGIHMPVWNLQSYTPVAIEIQQTEDEMVRVFIPETNLTIEMVKVPAGEFSMGVPDSARAPIHTVYLDTFWIDKTEVTNEQFTTFVTMADYTTTVGNEGQSHVDGIPTEGVTWLNPNGVGSNIVGLDNHPIVQVSWHDAVAYCKWRGARLPTEAEWEKAARGTESLLFPWGNQFDGNKLNACDINCSHAYKTAFNDQYAYTAPVGSYPSGASPYGILDMAGNVAEWTNDWYDLNYYRSSPKRNPLGPTDNEMPRPTLFNHFNSGSKVYRGGSWRSDEQSVSSVYRNSSFPQDSDTALGFRCALTEARSSK